jgi:DNA-binding IclR family transcriptional regulator
VTIPQACRLWSIDQPRCVRLLDTLLRSGFLRRSGDRYVRGDSGRRAA